MFNHLHREAVISTNTHGTHAGALAYRPDIDGMRALAVIAVIAFHAWPTWFAGGFVGVDIFFVISGFLITSILLSQLEKGKFSIADFYVRRIRRIFPALTVVMLATLAFGWVTLLQGEFQQIGKHAVAGTTFVSNLVLWNEAGYFDNDGITKPFLHLWSLGVEEQFYILWPLILWLVLSRKLRFLWVAGVIFVISMSANVLLVADHPVAAFFSPLTRFWELMAGGVVAYLHLHHAQRFTRHGTALSLGGAVLLGLAFWLTNEQSLFPGWWAMLPVGGACLLILAGKDALLNRQLLGRRLPVAIGLISYPLYLWHWPLLSYGHIVYGQKPPIAVKLALVGSGFVLAWLTYRLVEIPLRERANRARVTWSLGLGMVAIAVFGLTIGTGVLRERIDTHGAEPYLAALNDSQYPGPTLTPLRYEGVVFQKATSRGPGLTVFLGDSVMQQYGPRIEHAVATDPARFSSVIFATAGGCPPIEHTIRLPQIRFPLCPKTVKAAYALANSAEVDTVVLGAAWYGYFNAGQRELLFDKDGVQKAFPAADAQELAYESLRASIANLRKNGKRVFLVLQPPSGSAYDPHSMVTGSRFGTIAPLPKVPAFNLAEYRQRNAVPLARLSAIAADAGAIVIEPAQYMCQDQLCPVLDESGAPLYTDTIHMRPAYSRRAASFLDPTMLRGPAPASAQPTALASPAPAL
ncbi:acyltransferase family protein [Massilia genomosp. 1]|uniref:Acyltransferase family protein n=1 Tax=Massilia genomosp. 1 TaxID=2609280 RepID=A0ABX0MQT6_9BURK|nr:acyltransferase family protein [Massilia genomosp. 1]NHZ62863.1 acyltransferase family protein [Massilia genomosp. 1]